MYRLEPLLGRDDPDLLAQNAPDHHIEGTFGQYVVVSVPESCNMARAEEIKEQVMTLTKRPVVVMSHNISILKATKLSASDAAECIRKGEEYAEAMQARIADLAGDVHSPGSRPGICQPGAGGGDAAEVGGSAPVGDAGGGGNVEGPKEGDAGSSGSGG